MADDYTIQSLTATGSGTSLGLVLLSSVAAAHFLHAWAAGQSNPATSVADDINGSYTASPTASASNASSVQSVRSYYKENTGAGVTTVTATYSVSTDGAALVVQEVSYVNSASAIDKEAVSNNQNAAAAPVSGTTASTAQANEWVTAALTIRLSTLSSYTSGYIIRADSITFNGRKLSVGTLSVTTTGAQAFSATASGADDACGAIVTFKLTPPEPRPERVGVVAFGRAEPKKWLHL